MSRFQVGSKVHSSQLGTGEVLAVDGYGDKEKLTIRFEGSGIRHVLSKYFVLEPFDNELHAARPAPEPVAPPPPAPASWDVGTAGGEGPASAAGDSAGRPEGAEASRDGSSVAPRTPAPEPGRTAPFVSRAAPPSLTSTTGSIKEALREVIREEMGAPETKALDRWRGGTLVLQPGRAGQKAKEIPIDAFFHKIIMVRDRLRVLEQKINAHPGLAADEKIEMQQYITRIYGSLTTFNVLFADREDWFVGQQGADE